MKERTIEQLAYKLRKLKAQNEGAIFFLGAGVSVSAGIPLAGTLIENILEQFGDNPSIKNLSREQKSDYYSLMENIDHYDRKTFFKQYIDTAKINVSHVYLAQMMIRNYVDYILTVNFDNLSLRALALFNQFPAIYDIAILKGLNTSTFDYPGIVFLHGQHHGFNMLNTKDEFEEAKELVVSSLQRICGRPWIVVGYSGNDAVFDYISKLGRFDNGLYWVCYKDQEPSDKVKQHLLDKNNNSYIIKGFDSDTFFLKLNAALDLGQPDIIDKPFSHLQGLQNSIVDIDGENYITLKERMEISKRWISAAKAKYENQEREETNEYDIIRDLIKKELLDVIANEKYESIPELENKAENYLNDSDFKKTLSNGYSNWADKLDDENNNDLLDEVIEKYKKAIIYNDQNAVALYNLGTALIRKSKFLPKEQGLIVLTEALDILKKAAGIEEGQYNLACCYALLDQPENALASLETVLLTGEETFELVALDPDWNSLREHPKYIQLKERFSAKIF